MAAAERRRAFARAATLGWMLGGCYDVTAERLEPPITAGAESVVIALTTDDAFEVHARAVRDGATIDAVRPARPLAPGERLRVEVLAYRAPLAALGVAEGPLGASDAAEARPLPEGIALLAAEVRAGQPATEWEAASARSAPLAAFRVVQPPIACARLSPEVVRIDSTAAVMWAAELEPGVAWLGLHPDGEDTALRVGASGHTRVPLGFRGRAAFALGEGRAWLGTYDRALRRVRVTPDVALEAEVRLSEPTTVLAVAGSTASPELFALSVDGALHHFDGATSSVVYRTTLPRAATITGGLAWVGPSEALVAWHSEPGVVRVRRIDGAWSSTVERLPGAAEPPVSVARTPIGAVAGTIGGRFFAERSRGHWVELDGSPTSLVVHAIAPYGDGFVFGTVLSLVGQYSPSAGFCPLISLGQEEIAVKRLVSLGDGRVVAAGSSDVSGPAYAVLTPR